MEYQRRSFPHHILSPPHPHPSFPSFPSSLLPPTFPPSPSYKNPPAIPTLPLAWAAARLRGSKLVVDWHNYGVMVTVVCDGKGERRDGERSVAVFHCAPTVSSVSALLFRPFFSLPGYTLLGLSVGASHWLVKLAHRYAFLFPFIFPILELAHLLTHSLTLPHVTSDSKRIEKTFGSWSDCNFCVTDAMREDLRAHWGIK